MCVRFFFDCVVIEFGGFIKYIRFFLKIVLKAKVVKLVRNLVDVFLDMEVLIGMEVCKYCNSILCCFLFCYCRYYYFYYDYGFFNYL